MALLIRARAAAAVMAAVLAAGCEFIRPPTWVGGDPEQLLVHAVLVAGSDSATVLVNRVGGIDGRPVSGAQVRLLGDGAETTLLEVEEGRVPCANAIAPPGTHTGCYVAALPAPVRVGAEYRLEVNVPGEEPVRGRTVVPAPPEVLAPEDRLRVLADPLESRLRAPAPLTVRWTAPARATVSGWAPRAWSPEGPIVRCDTNFINYYYLNTPELYTDSAQVQVDVRDCYTGEGGYVSRVDSAEVMLGVTTYDESYLAYVAESQNGVPREQARSGLQGAFGVFGSAATVRRRIVLVAR